MPIPPVVADNGMPRIKPLETEDSFPSMRIMGITAASTMAVVAVFEMRLEVIIVTAMIPKRIHFGSLPQIFRA